MNKPLPGLAGLQKTAAGGSSCVCPSMRLNSVVDLKRFLPTRYAKNLSPYLFFTAATVLSATTTKCGGTGTDLSAAISVTRSKVWLRISRK